MRGGEGVAGSQPMSTAVLRSLNKLWRSNSIFYLWLISLWWLQSASTGRRTETGTTSRCAFAQMSFATVRSTRRENNINYLLYLLIIFYKIWTKKLTRCIRQQNFLTWVTDTTFLCKFNLCYYSSTEISDLGHGYRSLYVQLTSVFIHR